MSKPVASMLFTAAMQVDDAIARIQQDCYASEEEHCGFLRAQIALDDAARERINTRAMELVSKVRANSDERSSMAAFMLEYDLSSEEGIVLMCLAEALLRIPDVDTAEKLIADKLADADWEQHLGKSTSIFVNASTWGLMLTGRLIGVGRSTQKNFTHVLGRLANRSGEPVVRLAIRQAMRIMGHQFVMGRNINAALERSRNKSNRNFRHSFDMLGEAAITAADAQRYQQSYLSAIAAMGKRRSTDNIYAADSISVKLSALHPRYEFAQRERVLEELPARLLELAEAAASHDIALTMDAEEADRLVLSLEVFAKVASAPSLAGWQGLGLAIQAYQKRCWQVINYLEAVAKETGRRLPVRLVKGAYWDTEIKIAQQDGLPGYPVFTRKVNTDLSYLACAQRLLQQPELFYPQFATHNANTIAAIRELAGERDGYEYQRLHGMGEDLYDCVREDAQMLGQCRVYAPVGEHKDLLPYLVRRLLENGANTSFVNRISDEELTVEEVIADPLAEFDRLQHIVHPAIPLPIDLYGYAQGQGRRNSAGLPLFHEPALAALQQAMQAAWELPLQATPLLSFEPEAELPQQAVTEPAAPGRVIGYVNWATTTDVQQAMAASRKAVGAWAGLPVRERAAMLRQAADRLQQDHARFMALAVLEAGKSIRDAMAEVREAVDFLRYYADEAVTLMAEPKTMPGPTGETNQLYLHGRGVFACISPWNFPLAIFTGQIAAALVTGNCVLAKPAEQTPLIAFEMTRLLHAAGVPRDVLQFLPGDGVGVGASMTALPDLAGVVFTGSNGTAKLIHRSLAEHNHGIPIVIAETGGQNAMIVDSSALPEQVTRDVISSAFLSAGQRCSALRVLYVQDDIAEHLLTMLAGAMQELVVDNPAMLVTDIGPVIDKDALQMLLTHRRKLEQIGRLVAEVPVPETLPGGYFFPPCVFEIDSIKQLGQEVFGPVLHVIRYPSGQLDQVLDDIVATGFGLTLGIHSRIDAVHKYIIDRVWVGNIYINRNMTGAVVGVQPFGGEGLSGTGPKAGGPYYLPRFCAEKTLTNNTSAVGGNASLLAMSDSE
ncbi:MAG: bifunctional proline dehydrogenase/L-glutamate gamma-semialdehyde dehydrogenase PutA [Gammaproteobacteria bacterium]|jgi:RHH-type proline utilization regulon transcriptional repressor/proline dehydrogenase/delta 1-pyrroline-5-carboxylate dehydrogenase|nr:bifunctional proline dehydrogenase/L-glutamate gamma-semialdehyde dehydrogenase PutA [Gammaproteobacteria bacterium]